MIITDGWESGEIVPVQYIDSMGTDLDICDAARVPRSIPERWLRFDLTCVSSRERETMCT